MKYEDYIMANVRSYSSGEVFSAIEGQLVIVVVFAETADVLPRGGEVSFVLYQSCALQDSGEFVLQYYGQSPTDQMMSVKADGCKAVRTFTMPGCVPGGWEVLSSSEQLTMTT